MTPYELIQVYKEKKGIESDNAAAKELGLTRAAVSEVKRGGGLGPEYAWAIAEEIGMEPAEAIGICLVAKAERSGDAGKVAVWRERLERVSHYSLSVFFASALLGAGKQIVELCILCQIDHRSSLRAKLGF